MDRVRLEETSGHFQLYLRMDSVRVERWTGYSQGEIRIYDFPDDRLFRFCDKSISWLLYWFASCTVCYHFTLLLELSFRFMTIMVSLLTVAFLVRACFELRGSEQEPRFRINSVEGLALGAMCAVAAMLALLTIRPDADDVGYLSRAVHSFENAYQPIILHYPLAFISSTSRPIAVLPSYEHLCSTIAWVASRRPVEIYHFGAPIFFGALIPVGWFVLIRRLVPSSVGALVGVAAILLFLCVDGGTHRSFGNFCLVRIWQGKAILMSLLTPICIAYALDICLRPSSGRFFRLIAISVAGIGFSLMSAFFLPILYAVVVGSYWLMQPQLDRLKNIIWGSLCVSAYPVLRFAPHYLVQRESLAGSIYNLSWPADLHGIVSLVFGWPPGISVVFVILGLIILLFLRRWILLRFLLTWCALILVPLAFPSIAHWVTTNLTSRDAFWRILYALPVPLIPGVAAGLVYFDCPRLRSAVLSLLGLLAIAIFSTAAAGIGPSPWAKASVEFPAVRLKLPLEDLLACQAIVDRLQPGPMVSPLRISRTLPILTSKFPQCDDRGYHLDPIRQVDRILARKLVSGDDLSISAIHAFTQEIANPYRYVIVQSDVSPRVPVEKIAGEQGFGPVDVIASRYIVLEKAEHPLERN